MGLTARHVLLPNPSLVCWRKTLVATKPWSSVYHHSTFGPCGGERLVHVISDESSPLLLCLNCCVRTVSHSLLEAVARP
jgi:hypothetical protein